MITFRVGSPDAVFMENEFMPRFTPEDIINLPKAGVYLKLMIDGVASQPFSAVTLPPIAQRTGSMPRVIEQSRERYTGNRGAIEERVAVWSGFGAGVDVEKMIATVTQAKKDAKKARFSHEYTCTRCGKIFTLPVELDRARPIYCEECKPIIDAERQKAKERGGGSVVKKKIGDGEMVVKKTEGSVSLSQLTPKPVAIPVAAPAPVVVPEKHEHELVPLVPAAQVPSSQPVAVPVVRPQTASPVAPSTSPTSSDEQKKRKRRRNRKPRPEGAFAPAPVDVPPSIPRPQSPTAPRPAPEPAPQQVMPGERISFDT
jgi:DNA-directed RNA polymerase subunit RPC12/RpoP